MASNKIIIKYVLFFAFFAISFVFLGNFLETEAFLVKNTEQNKLSIDEDSAVNETENKGKIEEKENKSSFITTADPVTDEEEKLLQFEQSNDGKHLLNELGDAADEIVDATEEKFSTNGEKSFLQKKKNKEVVIPEDDPRKKIEIYEQTEEGHKLLDALSKVKGELSGTKEKKKRSKKGKSFIENDNEVLSEDDDDDED